MYRLRKIVITVMLFLTGGMIGFAVSKYFSVLESKSIYAAQGIDWLDIWFKLLKVYFEAYIVAMLIGAAFLICSNQYEKRKS